MQATKLQEQLTANILAQGFLDDPMWAFILPEVQPRLQALVAMFKLFVRDGIQRGEVLIDSNEQGAIVWYPANIEVFDDAFRQVQTEINSIAAHFGGQQAVERLKAIRQTLKPHAPAIPHHEIFWFAVLPQARSKGVGSRLLKQVLDRADADQMDCHLISSSSRNISFYKRQGFRQSGQTAIGTVSFTPMWRNPRSR